MRLQRAVSTCLTPWLSHSLWQRPSAALTHSLWSHIFTHSGKKNPLQQRRSQEKHGKWMFTRRKGEKSFKKVKLPPANVPLLESMLPKLSSKQGIGLFRWKSKRFQINVKLRRPRSLFSLWETHEIVRAVTENTEKCPVSPQVKHLSTRLSFFRHCYWWRNDGTQNNINDVCEPLVLGSLH